MEILRNSVIPIARPLIIESVKKLKETADVYCINVPEVSHFSLSNGAIVHNSDGADAFRYLAVSLHLIQDGYDAQTLNDLYLSSRTDSRNNVPRPFQEPNFY